MNEDPTSAPKKQKVDETLEGMNVMPEKTRLCFWRMFLSRP